MRTWRQRAGRRAERKARRHLERRGLSTIARNYSRPYGEIDLVMRDGPVVVFIEVRYRGPGSWLDGVHSVDAAKRRRLTRAAESFLQAHPEYGTDPTRFDVVSVSRTNFGRRIEWVADAFTGS